MAQFKDTTNHPVGFFPKSFQSLQDSIPEKDKPAWVEGTTTWTFKEELLPSLRPTLLGADGKFKVPPLILPVPLVGSVPPVFRGVFRVHAYVVVPGVVLLSTIVVILEPEQIVCEDGVATASGLFTVTVVLADAVQPPTVLVTVTV